MNLPLSLLLLLLGMLCSCHPKPPNEHDLLHLKGHVKEMTTKRYRTNKQDGKIVKGRLVSRNIDRAKYHEYEGVPIHSKVLFDKVKRMVAIDIYNRDEVMAVRTVLKDSVYTVYNNAGAVVGSMKMDAVDMPNRIDIYDGSGKLRQYSIITYDPHTQLKTGWQQFDDQDELVYAITYSYDNKNRISYVETEVMSNKRQARLRTSSERIFYDEHDHPIQVQVQENGQSKLITMEYTLDTKGNWIQSIETTDGVTNRIIERNLVYY